MRGLVSEIEIITPKNLNEALLILERENSQALNFKIIAGATDLGVEFNAGHLKFKKLLNIWNLRKEISGIKKEKTGIRIGALTSFTHIRNSNIIQKQFSNLSDAANLVGGVQIQNRGTIGGNIANASPAGDSLPALCAYDAVLTIQNNLGKRFVKINDFYNGYKKFDLMPDEIIVDIFLPFLAKNTKHYYRKVGTRQAQAISKVVVAGTAEVSRGVITKFSFSLGSVGPHTLRCPHTEKFLMGATLNKKNKTTLIQNAQEQLKKDITPRDDIRSTKIYREFVSRQLLGEFIKWL